MRGEMRGTGRAVGFVSSLYWLKARKERVYGARVVGATPLDTDLPPIEFVSREEEEQQWADLGVASWETLPSDEH